MRKAALLILMVSLLAYSCNEKVKKEKKIRQKKEIPTYTIGINLPLTGNGSYFGEELKKGFDVSFDHFNERTEKIHLELIYEDNKLNPKDAVTISRKFIDIDNVDLVIIGYTPIIQATVGMLNSAEVPMLLTVSSAENIAVDYEWAFRDFEMESETMPLLASYAYYGLNLKKGSYLVVNDDMGADVVKFFSDKFIEVGGSMAKGEVFESTEMDLRNKINKVMEQDPDFIIVTGRGSAMINAIRQIRERDPEIPLFGNNTVDNNRVWEALGESGTMIWFPRLYTDFLSDRYVNANERFRAKHGSDLNWLNIYGISIGNYLARGLKESAGDKESMRDYLSTLNFQSLRGKLIMDENSDVKMPHVIFRRIYGKSVPVEISEE